MVRPRQPPADARRCWIRAAGLGGKRRVAARRMAVGTIDQPQGAAVLTVLPRRAVDCGVPRNRPDFRVDGPLIVLRRVKRMIDVGTTPPTVPLGPQDIPWT